MLGVLTDVEFVAKLFNDLLGDLSLEDSQELNVLTSIKFDLEHADWLLLLLLHWWSHASRCLGLDLWVSSLGRGVVSWLGGSLVLVGASISSGSGSWLGGVLLLFSHGITWGTLGSWIVSLLLSVVSEWLISLSKRVLVLALLLLLESGRWLTVSVWELLLLLHDWSSVSK